MSTKEGVKLKFKVQQYQTDAVNSTCDVFEGQPFNDGATYRIDPGKIKDGTIDFNEYTGYRNADILLTPEDILKNIQTIQQLNGIPESTELSNDSAKAKKKSKGCAPYNLDIEMETGTGKTYVYIKTMFELNRRYGWTKFIVVVPSIAIREGVAESFQMLEGHFFEQYGKKIRWFVYNSKNTDDIQNYSHDGNINCMIINSQAFASSMKEGALNKAALKIYSEQDSFQSRRPIEVIAANHPIVILDEPQRLGGTATQDGIRKFNPLFALNYSATHAELHDCIYALDALDSFNQRLVKRINAIGHKIENPAPTAYISVKEIVSSKKAIKARLEVLEKLKSGNNKITIKDLQQGDSLAQATKLPSEYEGYQISDINAVLQTVSFTNGVTLRVGQIVGDGSYRSELQRMQIRKTIKVHFAKERELFKRGIKCISLFFIDFVSNYRQYDAEGNEQKGPLMQIFEEEYARLVEKEKHAWDKDYNDYLDMFTPQSSHTGYFSIDKNKRMVNTESDKEGDSDDREAYDRILKDKAWLLSMSKDSPRFIFSHSALREGWDNPNVFQICMLRNSTNQTSRRQEVGRGLRICVDKNGVRQDAELLGEDFFEVNELTVIANESYAEFSSGLQNEILRNLRKRPDKVDDAYLKQFIGKKIRTDDGGVREIDDDDIVALRYYLSSNKYVDKTTKEPTPEYRVASAENRLKPFPEEIADLSNSFKKIVDAVLDNDVLAKLLNDITDQETTETNHLNDNFTKAEFQALWNEINHKYVYTVHYDSDELIRKAVKSLNEKLDVPVPRIIFVNGKLKRNETGTLEFKSGVSEPETGYGQIDFSQSSATYDLLGRIASSTKLTRRTVATILKELTEDKLKMFSYNPEMFISQASQLIRAEKATMIVSHIQYDPTEQKYDSAIFTLKTKGDIKKAIKATKHISDYVFFDSDGERQFAENLEIAKDVVVYAKLPRTFQIPTPVGNYAPDWAIAFESDGIKHIYFIAETKGTMDTMQLKQVELAKIECAKKLFNIYSTHNVRYEHVDSFEKLRDALDKYVASAK